MPLAPEPSSPPLTVTVTGGGRCPTLHAADERAVIERVQGGDPAARAEITAAYLRPVIAIAHSFGRSRAPFSVLITAGCDGVQQGAQKFDSALGVPFRNYVAYWIKQRMMREIAERMEGAGSLTVVPRPTPTVAPAPGRGGRTAASARPSPRQR